MYNIKVNCHSSICINNNIYIDPFKINESLNNAEFILITHPHWDHLDIESIKNVMNNKTVFVCTSDSKEELVSNNIDENKIIVVKPYDKKVIENIKIETFPVYNTNKKFHPKENNWIGYNLIIDGVTYTICGDSDNTEELQQLNTDILFVPIGGTYTMNPKEAAELTNIIKPKLVVPVHYGEIVGDITLKDLFIKYLNKSINYKILI